MASIIVLAAFLLAAPVLAFIADYLLTPNLTKIEKLILNMDGDQ